jgi:hypothetical protein
MIICDLSGSPSIDLAGSKMLQELHRPLASRKIDLYMSANMAMSAMSCGPMASAINSVESGDDILQRGG